MQDPACWALKQEVLQVAVQLVSFFAKPLEAYMPALLGPVWCMFTGQGLQVYQVNHCYAVQHQ